MKRFLVTILSILYMVSASGATIHVHYCMGKLTNARLGHDDDDKCGKCGMKKCVSKGCCKVEHKSIKTSDHQSAKAQVDVAYQQMGGDLPRPALYYTAIMRPAQFTAGIIQSHAPPFLRQTCPVYIQFRNFRV